MLTRLDAVLTREVRYSDNYDTAKLQLAVFYYWTKASRAARAAIQIAEAGSVAEGLLLLRGLYDLVVDCLWMCLEPLDRARLFYDATAVEFERQRELLLKLGVTQFDPETLKGIEHNREHFERVAHRFKTSKGRDRPHWAPGTIRDRAQQVERRDPEMVGLEDMYVLLYKTLSAYEHSAPSLCFQFVTMKDRTFAPADNPSIVSRDGFGQALGLLLGGLVKKTMHHLGVTPEDFK